jgi:hypothetical protein
MRQASWIAFLLLTVGLLSYEAAVGNGPEAPVGASATSSSEPSTPELAEGGGDIPPNN